jgi:hypothetical protein
MPGLKITNKKLITVQKNEIRLNIVEKKLIAIGSKIYWGGIIWYLKKTGRNFKITPRFFSY